MKKILLLGALFAVNLWAVNDIEVKNAFVKQTPPHAQNSAIFLTIFNSLCSFLFNIWALVGR